GDVIDEQGHQVLSTVGEALARLNVALDSQRLDYELPARNAPQMELQETQSMLDTSFRAIAEKYDLSEEEGAHAAAVSTAVLIQKCSEWLDPHIGYTIAFYGMVEACKTVPLM